MEINMEFRIGNTVSVSGDTTASSKNGKSAMVKVQGYSAWLTKEEARDMIRALEILTSDGLTTLKEGGVTPPALPDPSRDSHSAWDTGKEY